MNIVVSPEAKKQLTKLPQTVLEKTRKQFHFLIENYRHPSLKTSKMKGRKVFEARIDLHYRFSFVVEADQIMVLTVGQHDKGLGKK